MTRLEHPVRRLREALREALLVYWPAGFWKYLELRYGDAQLEPEIKLLPFLCRRGAAAVDVGAHFGVYTFFLRRYASPTFAFEPNPSLAALLRRQSRGWPDVKVRQMALSNHPGRARLRVPAGRPGRATLATANDLREDLAGRPIEEIDVELGRLDDLGVPAVGFMKIDVEGHELEVLQGARELLQRDRPTLLIEIEERHRAGSLQAVVDLLRPLEYRALFFRGGSLHLVEAFDAAVNQNAAAPERYVRNFIFVQRDQEERVRAFIPT